MEPPGAPSGGSSPTLSASATSDAVDGHPLVADARSGDSLTRLRAILALRSLPPGGVEDDAHPPASLVSAAVLRAVLTPRDREPDVHTRSTAASAIGMCPFPGAYELLMDLVAHDPSEEVRASAIGALGYLGNPRAAPDLRRALLEDTHWSARQSAAVALGMLKDQAAYELLVEGATARGLDDGGGMVRACVGALGELGDTRAVGLVIDVLEGRASGGQGAGDGASAFISKQVAAEALGGLPCAEAVAALEKVADSSEHVNVVWAAELSLKKLRASMDPPTADGAAGADPPPAS